MIDSCEYMVIVRDRDSAKQYRYKGSLQELSLEREESDQKGYDLLWAMSDKWIHLTL